MAQRIVSTNVRLLPAFDLEPPASDPVSTEAESSLAELAVLAGLDPTDRNVSAYVASFTNTTISRVQGATL